MPPWFDELAAFYATVVTGKPPSPQVTASYAHYAGDSAWEIYRNNYLGNLHDALAGAYPVIVQLVGAEFFRFMARQFIAAHPSRSGNLHHYGAELAEFLAGLEAARSVAYLPDMARLEWACHTAYFAADAVPLGVAALAGISPEQYEQLCFSLHPALHIVRSPYPVASVWQAHQGGAVHEIHLDTAHDSGIALVTRPAHTVQVQPLSAALADWLQALQHGIALGEATQQTLHRHADFDLPGALQFVFAQALVCKLGAGQTT